MNKAVMEIYTLRFQVITVYVIGMISAFFFSLQYMTPIGFSVGIGETAIMGMLDFTLMERQIIFVFRAMKLEGKIKEQREKDPNMSEGAFTMYFMECWNHEKECKETSLADFTKKKNWYFLKTRGLLYILIALLLAAYVIVAYIIY
jgi:hypothetical protein